jgi:two-component system chemotaxis response regulator CheB
MHTSPQSPGVLPDILQRSGPLPASHPRNLERIQAGRIYVAPPDRHLIIEPGVLRVTKGPKENRFRPAIDPLFRSAAQVFGPAAIGVILTGNLDDGTAGIWAIKQLGGVAIVQDPEEALFPSMPRSALEHAPIDHSVRLSEIGPLLVALTQTDRRGDFAIPEHLKVEVNIATEQNALEAGLELVATPSSFTCPECHGVLLQLKQEGRVRFRCHTGHGYSAATLLAAVDDSIEEATWGAIRVLEEGGLLLRRLAEHVRDQHDADQAKSLLDRADEVRRQSEILREIVVSREPLGAKA